jgi:hypothetical protein
VRNLRKTRRYSVMQLEHLPALFALACCQLFAVAGHKCVGAAHRLLRQSTLQAASTQARANAPYGLPVVAALRENAAALGMVGMARAAASAISLRLVAGPPRPQQNYVASLAPPRQPRRERRVSGLGRSTCAMWLVGAGKEGLERGYRVGVVWIGGAGS